MKNIAKIYRKQKNANFKILLSLKWKKVQYAVYNDI